MIWDNVNKKEETSTEEIYIVEITDDEKDSNALLRIVLIDIEHDKARNNYEFPVGENNTATVLVTALDDIHLDQDCHMYIHLICGSCEKKDCNCGNKEIYQRFQLMDSENKQTVKRAEIPNMDQGNEQQYTIRANLANFKKPGDCAPFRIEAYLIVSKNIDGYKYIELE